LGVNLGDFLIKQPPRRVNIVYDGGVDDDVIDGAESDIVPDSSEARYATARIT